MRRTIKLKSDCPVWLENRLITKFGYYIQQRKYKEAIIFVKLAGVQTIPDEPLPNTVSGLTKAQEENLVNRCDRIVDYFVDPYNMMSTVRTRLHNMRQTLRTAPEQQFVLEYMDENFPEGAK